MKRPLTAADATTMPPPLPPFPKRRSVQRSHHQKSHHQQHQQQKQQQQQQYPVVVRVMPDRQQWAQLTSEPSPTLPFRVVVEGIMGSGKSHFLDYAASRLGQQLLDVRPEPVDQWTNFGGINLLAEAYRDPDKHLLALQVLILTTLGERLLQSTTRPIILQERSQRSVLFFIETMLAAGKLTAIQYAVLQRLHQLHAGHRSDIESADMVIYLRTPPEKAYERVLMRDRAGEKVVTLEYLQHLNDEHESYFGGACPHLKFLVRLDTTHDRSAPESYDTVLAHVLRRAITMGFLAEDTTGLTEGPYTSAEVGPVDVVVTPSSIDWVALETIMASIAESSDPPPMETTPYYPTTAALYAALAEYISDQSDEGFHSAASDMSDTDLIEGLFNPAASGLFSPSKASPDMDQAVPSGKITVEKQVENDLYTLVNL